MPDIIDNAYVIVEFENGSRGMLDLCMFAEGSKNEQEISVVGEIGKVNSSSISFHRHFLFWTYPYSILADSEITLEQGEAFVPENIIRWGTRVEGRDGVKTLKAEDDRIK